MSEAGTAAKPKYRFCWVCSRKLHGNFHRVAIVHPGTEHEHEVIVHERCGERERLQLKPDAHLANPPKVKTPPKKAAVVSKVKTQTKAAAPKKK